MSNQITDWAERFRSEVLDLVQNADDKGNLIMRGDLPFTWSQLAEVERLRVRMWAHDKQRAAVMRCDVRTAKAFGQIRDRIRNYSTP